MATRRPRRRPTKITAHRAAVTAASGARVELPQTKSTAPPPPSRLAPPPPPRLAYTGEGCPRRRAAVRPPLAQSFPTLSLSFSLSPGRGRSSGWKGARPLPSRGAAAASSGGAVRRRSRAGPRRRGGGHEHGCVRRARRIRRRPRWRTPAARLGFVGRAAPFAAAEGYARCRAGLRSSAPAVPPLSLFSELGLGAGEASRRLAGGGRRPGRGARGGGRQEVWRGLRVDFRKR